MEVSRQAFGHVPGRPGRRWPSSRLPALIAAGAAAVVAAGCVTAVGSGGTDARGSGVGGPVPAAPGLASGPTTAAPGVAGPPAAPPSADPPARPDVVPPGLVGRGWIAPLPGGAVVGIAGSDARLRLDDGEFPLAVTDAVVATAGTTAGGAGSDVRLRSVRDGRVGLEVERPEQVDSMAFAGDRLLVSGHDPARPSSDTGVAAVSLVDGGTASLVEPDPSAGAGAAVARSVRVSPSGRTAVSGLCSAEGCAIDVVGLGDGRVRRLVRSGPDFPGVLTDRVLIVGAADSSSIAGIDIATGRVLWRRTGAEFQYAYATTDGQVVQSYVDHADPYTFVVAVLDPQTGTERVVLRRDVADGLTLWPGLSTDDLAVLGTGGTFEDAAAAGGWVHAGTLDLATGALEPDAVEIRVAP